MKYGLMVVKKTVNIGDDIQSYAAKRFLPRVDYLVDGMHFDDFIPEKEEVVATIINGWYIHHTLNWPLSPFLKPLPISMHFSMKDWYWFNTERPYYLEGLGIEYFKSIEPIKCRDTHSCEVLKERGVKAEFSGCLTLTLEKFPNIEKQDYICAVDVSPEIVQKIKDSTKMEVKEINHVFMEGYNTLSWEERLARVEESLKTYQAAKYIITTRLHCALPSTALGSDVLLITQKLHDDRFKDFFDILRISTEEEFLEKENVLDYVEKDINREKLNQIRSGLINECETFIKECENSDEKYENGISVNDYKEYVIKKSDHLKNAYAELYDRYDNTRKERNKKDEEIIEKNSEIETKTKDLNYYKEEFEGCLEKMETYKQELEKIKNSRLWKIRDKIRGNKSN